MLASSETSPDLRFPLRATSASTSTPLARRLAWSASISSVANAQKVWLPPVPLPSLRATSAIAFGGAGRGHLDPATALTVGKVGALLEPELGEIEFQRSVLVGNGDEHGANLSDTGLVCRVGHGWPLGWSNGWDVGPRATIAPWRIEGTDSNGAAHLAEVSGRG
jgi:hypothetical protein